MKKTEKIDHVGNLRQSHQQQMTPKLPSLLIQAWWLQNKGSLEFSYILNILISV